jgi:hypothetical protein
LEILRGKPDGVKPLLRSSPLIRQYSKQGNTLLAASRGDYATTRTLTDHLIQWAAPRGVVFVHYGARHALGLAALGRGDFEEAYQQTSAISPAGVLASHVPVATWVMMDLVEAAVRTNRQAEAAAPAKIPAGTGFLATRAVSALDQISCGGRCPPACPR